MINEVLITGGKTMPNRVFPHAVRIDCLMAPVIGTGLAPTDMEIWGPQMAQQSAFDDQAKLSGAAATPHAQAYKAAMLQVVMRAHLLRGALDNARAAADLLAQLAGQPKGLFVLFEAALDLDQVQLARTILSEAEGKGRVTAHETALMRARIAQTQGDMAAAKAILVSAIEATPDEVAPRRALAEVMVAIGTAADTRTVLNHLGGATTQTPNATQAKTD